MGLIFKHKDVKEEERDTTKKSAWDVMCDAWLELLRPSLHSLITNPSLLLTFPRVSV